MALFGGEESAVSSSLSFSTTGRGDTKISKWAPECLPTYVVGFDKLMHGAKDADGKEKTGGLPLGAPGVTTMAGGPGAGKSLFGYNSAERHLALGHPVLWFTLEKPIKEVGWNIQNIAKVVGDLGDKLKYEEDPDGFTIKGFECYDYFSNGVNKRTPFSIANDILDWKKRTKGQLVVIDSVTELTVYEMHLREVLKNLITTISGELVNKKNPEDSQMAILMTSQYRGAYKDAGIAGGLAIGHRSNAVIQLEALYVTNFDKKYYDASRGSQIRKIWVEKTASFTHETSEYFYSISKEGLVSVSNEPIGGKSSTRCDFCSEGIDMTGEYATIMDGEERKYLHTKCFLSQTKQGKKSVTSEPNLFSQT